MVYTKRFSLDGYPSNSFNKIILTHDILLPKPWLTHISTWMQEPEHKVSKMFSKY